MSINSDIEWTDATWNPVRGCTKVSAGCKHCYAETFAERFRGVPGHPFEQGFDLLLVPKMLDLPKTWSRPRRVFVNSMSDLFHPDVPESYVRSVFDVMMACPQHTFQILTKRSQHLVEMAPRLHWPSNVWMGVSVENERVSSRVDDLREVPAAIRFLSLEPLLGPLLDLDLRGIDWVIVGGESGNRARPVEADWVRSIRDVCRDSGVPFFFKQWGGRRRKEAGRCLDGQLHDEIPSRPARGQARGGYERAGLLSGA